MTRLTETELDPLGILESAIDADGIVTLINRKGCEILGYPETEVVGRNYRMVQEALTNVARHARATEVRVSLAVADGVLLNRVADSGVGLPAPPEGRRSYGLLGIRERARTLGGEARIYSPPAGGTVVEISIPLARYAEAEVAP